MWEGCREDSFVQGAAPWVPGYGLWPLCVRVCLCVCVCMSVCMCVYVCTRVLVGWLCVRWVDACSFGQFALRVLPYLHERGKVKEEIKFLITCYGKGNIKYNMTTNTLIPSS